MTQPAIRICFVCLGNICRSPTAEGVMKALIAEAKLDDQFFVDSAGTGAYHAGEAADARSAAAARLHGVELTSRARQFVSADFANFDYVVAMDQKNRMHLLGMTQNASEAAKVSLLRAFDEASQRAKNQDVPDPYFKDNFDEVFEICRAGCLGLLDHIRRERGLPV